MKQKLKKEKTEIFMHTICADGYDGKYHLTSADPLAEGLEKARKLAEEGTVGLKGPVAGFLIVKHIARPEFPDKDKLVVLQPNSSFGKLLPEGVERDAYGDSVVDTVVGTLNCLMRGNRIYDVKTGALTFEAK